MEIKFGKEDVNGLIEDYYKKYENIDCTVKTIVKKDRDRYDDYICNLSYIVTRKIVICGKERLVPCTITEDGVDYIIKTMLSDEGYEVNRISFERGLTSKSIGYGLGERIEKVPYYNGVTVYAENVFRKVKK